MFADRWHPAQGRFPIQSLYIAQIQQNIALFPIVLCSNSQSFTKQHRPLFLHDLCGFPPLLMLLPGVCVTECGSQLLSRWVSARVQTTSSRSSCTKKCRACSCAGHRYGYRPDPVRSRPAIFPAGRRSHCAPSALACTRCLINFPYFAHKKHVRIALRACFL